MNSPENIESPEEEAMSSPKICLLMCEADDGACDTVHALAPAIKGSNVGGEKLKRENEGREFGSKCRQFDMGICFPIFFLFLDVKKESPNINH